MKKYFDDARGAGLSDGQAQRFTALAIAMGLAIAVAGCAAPATVASGKPWKIAPSYRVTHTGPGADQGYMALARQYEGELRWQAAREAWRKAALEAPDDADALNGLGMAEARRGRYADSVAALRRAVATAPDRVALRNNLGYALLLDGQDDEARTVLHDALERDPKNRLLRANLDRLDPIAGMAFATDKNPAIDANAPPLTVAGRMQTTPNLAPLQLRQTGFTAPTVAAPHAVATPVALAAPVAPHVPSTAPRIDIVNGNGSTGMAGRLRTELGTRGVVGQMVLSNVLPYDTVTTVVRYRSGFAAVARYVADGMPRRADIAAGPGGALGADVRVILGRDQL